MKLLRTGFFMDRQFARPVSIGQRRQMGWQQVASLRRVGDEREKKYEKDKKVLGQRHDSSTSRLGLSQQKKRGQA
jgi:hypothetical protein